MRKYSNGMIGVRNWKKMTMMLGFNDVQTLLSVAWIHY